MLGRRSLRIEVAVAAAAVLSAAVACGSDDDGEALPTTTATTPTTSATSTTVASVVRTTVVASLPTTATDATTPPGIVSVDQFGADPFDDRPDSEAIQAALRSLVPGDRLVFTSGAGRSDHVGYLIDRTLFIATHSPISDITLTSTDPDRPALLRATPELLGFVIHLTSRTLYQHPLGLLDDIRLEHLHVDGGRDVRSAVGSDGRADGVGDNWGSWIDGECVIADDPWCNPGGISLSGGIVPQDLHQDVASSPDDWSTGIAVHALRITNVESGTALGLTAAESSITDTVVDTAGEHTHIEGCEVGDSDGELGRWADGMTVDGTGITIEGNTVVNATDIGIVFMGGRDARIARNTVISEPGNNGAFAAIAVHTWGPSDVSGLEIVENHVINESDTECGGVHVGINLGTHMWGGGCREADWANVGNTGTCEDDPPAPDGALCPRGQQCQIWVHIPDGASASLVDNLVEGAQINYLIGGVDAQGDLVVDGNVSRSPRETDWYAASFGCANQSIETTWGTLDFVARHPTIPGWDTQLVHCEW